ncbi:MAG: iron-containing alcohol dehydrogenase, partial [Planctomycetaceae bacterium]
MSHAQRTTWDFYSAGRVVFGCGAVDRLGALSLRIGTQHALVVTDQGLASCGAVDRVQQSLLAAGVRVSVFDGGEPEPSVDAAIAAVKCAHEVQPDVIVGLGGGSNLDLAKITANLFRHGGTPQNYFGFDQIPGPTLPLIAIPTTAGTGSEVSHAAVLTDTASEMKFSTLSPHLRPKLAVVDPELTVTCPAVATADSGIDALTHAIESYTAIDHTDLDIPVEQDV